MSSHAFSSLGRGTVTTTPAFSAQSFDQQSLPERGRRPAHLPVTSTSRSADASTGRTAPLRMQAEISVRAAAMRRMTEKNNDNQPAQAGRLELADKLQQAREIAVQATQAIATVERESLDQEYKKILSDIDRMSWYSTSSRDTVQRKIAALELYAGIEKDKPQEASIQNPVKPAVKADGSSLRYTEGNVMNIAGLGAPSGVQYGLNRLDQASAGVAKGAAEGDAGKVAAGLVDQKTSALQVKAATNVIKAKDEMIGSIIDVTV